MATPERKLALARTWLAQWLDEGIWLHGMPEQWMQLHVKTHRGKFKAVDRLLTEKGSAAAFVRDWLPRLLELFAVRAGGTPAKPLYRLRGSELSLTIGGDWEYCQLCRGVLPEAMAGRGALPTLWIRRGPRGKPRHRPCVCRS